MSGREAVLDNARTAYGRNDWTADRSRLLDADAQETLEAADLERLAWSCRWVSDEAGFLNALERAEVAFGAAGDRAAAARMALEQARQHVQMLDESVAVTRLEIKAASRAVEEIGAVVDLVIAPPRPEPAKRALRTFLFSDIVDSTRLAEAMGDDTWEQLLRWHDRILRAEFARWRGEEVKHGGDGFFVAFGQPDDAIACAIAIQRALARHRTDHGFAPTVRIGLHAGEATARDDDYFGSAVTRAARISAAAGAGEVLVSTDLLARCERTVPVAGERTLELKGIAEPLTAALIAWSDENGVEPSAP